MSTQSSTRTARRPRWLFTLLMVLLGLFGTGLLVFISVISYGVVHGEDFSPDTFQSREYTYFQVPLLGIQVSPVSYSANTGVLARHLLAQGWVVASSRGKPHWHFVYRAQGRRVMGRGDAEILVNYLEQQDSNYSLLWKVWSDDHPQLAKLLWPTVAELARDELYMFIPELLQCAQETTDPVEFQEEMNIYLARQYVFLGATHSSRGDHEQANDCYEEALKRDPTNVDALRATGSEE